ncbi:MAG: tetratricopeptide repeat protein [Gammaproteobacteria bacterium]|nr:tetratricopeptide repeat protein [Gammaproteobacteria bacterium]
MNEYETEEQQLEALKKWWKENGTSLIVGLVVGVSALFGWRYYLAQTHAHNMQASDMYMQLAQNVALKNIDDKTIDISNQLTNDFSDTPYAALSSLALAKAEYETGDIDRAETQLELAVKYANDSVIKQIANLRLIRLYIEQEKFDEALSLLNMEHDAAYDPQYEELKGDVYSASGKLELARVAYDEAIRLGGASTSKWLRLKRQNLGVSTEKTASQQTSGLSSKSAAGAANNEIARLVSSLNLSV